MRVWEAMHKNATWVPPTMPVSEVAKLMKDQDIGALPVGENDRLIGMEGEKGPQASTVRLMGKHGLR